MAEGIVGTLVKLWGSRNAPKWAVVVFIGSSTVAFLLFLYLLFIERRVFGDTWSSNANAFIAPLAVFGAGVGVYFIGLGTGYERKAANPAGTIATSRQADKNPESITTATVKRLEAYFEPNELATLRAAYANAKDQDQVTLIGLLSMSAPMEKLERTYHLGQVYFLKLCLHLIDIENYRVQLRINPYGKWTEKEKFSARNARYLAVSIVWSLATKHRLLPSPLVSDDFSNSEYHQSSSVQAALSEFRRIIVGPGINRMPSDAGHQIYESLRAWRLNGKSTVSSHIDGACDRVTDYYKRKSIELQRYEVLSMFYLFLYKFSTTNFEDISLATVSYSRLGENCILLECEKNRYFMVGHAALAKLAAIRFPTLVFFRGVTSLGLNSNSEFMKGGTQEANGNLISIHDICESGWESRVQSEVEKARAELMGLFGVDEQRGDKLSSIISSHAKRLRDSVSRAQVFYAERPITADDT